MLLDKNRLALEDKYLEEHIFSGLTNLNTGFDVASIKYFSATDFSKILYLVKMQKLGIHGIEPWKDGIFFDEVVFKDAEDYKKHRTAFDAFNKRDGSLQYAATYYVPSELLGIDEEE